MPVDAIQVPPLANIGLCGQQECELFDGAACLLAITGLHLQTDAFPSQNVLIREVSLGVREWLLTNLWASIAAR